MRNCASMLRSTLSQTPLALLLIAPALAASPPEQRGKTFATNNCARCHAIGRVGESPLKIAPAFRTLHKRYPVETLAEALAEGIQTGHPTMPEFQLDPDQIHDLLSYLKTLE
jgi:cytochrome c